MNIKFKINGQSLLRCDDNIIAANGQKYLGAEFETDPVWDGYTITACFTRKRTAYHVILDGNRCTVPFEVLGTGKFFVSLIGVHNEDPANRITTEKVSVKVEPGPELDSENASEPTATEIEQLMSLSAKAVDAAEKVKADADNGTFSAKISEVSAVTVSSDIPASVENTGTESEAKFVFKIPQGKTGDKGDRGIPGESFYAFFSSEDVDTYIVERKPVSFNMLWLGTEESVWVYGTVYNFAVSYDDEGNVSAVNTTKQSSLIAIGPAGESMIIFDTTSALNSKVRNYTGVYLSFLWAGEKTTYTYTNAASKEESCDLCKGCLYRASVVSNRIVLIKDMGNLHGTSVTIESVSAESVSSDEEPSVENTGTSSAAKFHFKIPKGAQGKSNYDIYVEQGGTLSEAEWLESLNGESVTFESVVESTEDGGENTITFSNGKSLTVRNGKTGAPGYTPQKDVDYFDGVNAEMYSYKVYKVYSLSDIENLCAARSITEFKVINCGEAFEYTTSNGIVTTVNTGDIFSITASNGALVGMMYLDNSTVETEEGTLIQWFELQEDGSYKDRYTPVLSGADGATPNFTIGTVETLAAGSKATASVTGTAAKPVLNLGIPKGADATGGGSETYEAIGTYDISGGTIDVSFLSLKKISLYFSIPAGYSASSMSLLVYMHTNSANEPVLCHGHAVATSTKPIGGRIDIEGRPWFSVKSVVAVGDANTADTADPYALSTSQFSETIAPYHINSSIQRIKLALLGGTLPSGSTALLYGVKA